MKDNRLISWLRNLNTALPGLLSGIFLFGVFCELIGIFLVNDIKDYSIGLWIGVLTAVFMAFHMAFSLNSALMPTRLPSTKTSAPGTLLVTMSWPFEPTTSLLAKASAEA